MADNYLGTIIRINADNTEFVINKGNEHGVRKGYKFLIIEIGESIEDPETGENLGELEIIKGEAMTLHIQDKMSTLISNEYIIKPGVEEVIYRNAQPRSNMGLGVSWARDNAPASKIVTEPVKVLKPLLKVKIGDKVKLISRF